MVSEETILNYPDWTVVPFLDVHTEASDKQLGAVISQNNKPQGPIELYYDRERTSLDR